MIPTIPTPKNQTRSGLMSLRTIPASLFFCAVAGLFATSLPIPVLAQEPSLNESKLTFVGADIESVIKAIGHYTGTTFIIDPRVKGSINLVSEQPVTKAQAFELLTSTLRLQGYAVVTANGFTKVVPESDGKLQAGPTQATGVKGDQIATQVFRLNYESAGNLVTVLRPLISPNNTVNANPGNNSIVITDYADNLKRLAKIIAALDVPSTSEVEVIPIRYGIATDVATLLMRLTDQNAPSVDSGKITILADSRTNAILLHAPSEARANLVKTIIKKLDQPTALPGNVHVVYLRNAEAVKLAQTLRAIASTDSSAGGSSSGGAQSNNSNQNQPAQNRAMGGNSGASGTGGGGGLGNALGSAGSSSGSNSNNNTLPTGGQTGYIQADAATNTLIITASETVYRNLRSVIDQLDSRRSQVYIEALIIEVSTSKIDQFGVQWAAISGNSSNQVRAGAETAFNTVPQNNLFTLAAAGKTAVPAAGMNFGIFSSSLGLGAIASALQSSGNANVLSVPTVTTLDNEEAKMLVGQNVPFVTGSYANTVASAGGTVNPFQTVERKDVGVILKVRPQISEGGSVKLNIYQEVSNVNSTSNPAGIVTDVRALETNVVVDDGELLVLGGLMSEDSNAQEDQVPLLGDIPYLGNLFKYKNKTHEKRNLLIFLRPTVIRNHEQSNSVSIDRYDYMRAKSMTDKSNDPMLNVPSLSPEMQGILIPQTILKRETVQSKLDQPRAETAPVSSPDNTVTPAESAK